MLIQLIELNILRYITFRAALAAVTAFTIGIVAGPPMIAWLRRRKVGERIAKGDSDELDLRHASKEGTPTMGGLLIVGAALIAILLFARIDQFFPQLMVAAILMLGLLGFVDDYRKLTTRGKGLRIRPKLCLQAAIAMLLGLTIYCHYADAEFAASAYELDEAMVAAEETVTEMESGAGTLSLREMEPVPVSAEPVPVRTYPNLVQGTTLYVPFFKRVRIALGLGFVIFAALVIVATANAVNLTDGLDGLAAGSSLSVLLVFTGIAYAVGRSDFSGYLMLPFVPGAGEAAVCGAAMLGAVLSFLWFNAHPAEVFMGDTGSLAVGGAIAVLAIAVKQELLLPLAAGIFVFEALSVLFQIASFKLLGRRIFRIAPVHHHFQFGGLHETKVTVRFWIVGVILAVLALATLKVR